VAPHPGGDASSVIEVGVKLTGACYAANSFAHGSPTVIQSAVGRRSVGTDDDIGTSTIRQFPDCRTNNACWSHLLKNGASRHVGRLDLKTGRRSRDKAFDSRLRWQSHAHVQTAVRRRLVAAPSHRSRRQTLLCEFGLAKAPNQLSEFDVIQMANVVRCDVKHCASEPCETNLIVAILYSDSGSRPPLAGAADVVSG
jgi:hypothetical protein